MDETTKTRLDDVAAGIRRASEQFRQGAQALQQSSAAWAKYEQERRFRAAMQGMANVMACVNVALERLGLELGAYTSGQRYEMTRLNGAVTCARASVEWSRRVREGVKALRPSGPVVAVQGDWEDD